MSLKAIAEEGLARLKAGEMEHETERETRLKQVKQDNPCFTTPSARFTPVKHAKRQRTAKKSVCFTVSFPRGETDETSLSEEVTAGLEQLATIRPPRLTRPELWSAIVADALRLAADGWAAHALRLGWSPLELWGCSPDRGGNPNHEGLAVWLDGRRVLLIDDATCIVESGPDARSVFHRRSVAAGGVFLWNLGKPNAR